MTSKISILFILTAVLVTASGCKKWRDNREALTSEDHTLAEASFNDLMGHLLILASPGGDLLTDSCFSYTSSGSGFPRTVMVDFGSKGCTGLLGFETYGQVTVTLSDSIQRQNAVLTATPADLHINGYKVDGFVVITNLGLNGSGHPQYQVEVSSGVITATLEEAGDDYTVHWQCDYLYEVVEKNNEELLLDDLFSITGSASGVNREDRKFTATITTPLLKYVNCRWPGEGKTNIAPDDLKERTLNYGTCESSNCCDNVASEEVKWPDKTVRMK